MSNPALGALAAIVASSLFSVGLILQSIEAKRVPATHSFHWALIILLARHPRWLLGGLVMLTGFGCHVLAFTLAPLTVVQPALAAGLLVLVVVGLRAESARPGRREIVGTAGIAAGIVALTFTTPAATEADASPASLAIALVALGAAVVIPHVLALHRREERGHGRLLATFGAGAGYAMTGITTKLASDELGAGDPPAVAFWLALTMLVAAIALIDQTSALQNSSAIEVGPIVYVVPVVLPVLLAPALVGESWSDAPHGAAPLFLALVIVCVGTAALAGSSSVAAAEPTPTDH